MPPRASSALLSPKILQKCRFHPSIPIQRHSFSILASRNKNERQNPRLLSSKAQCQFHTSHSIPSSKSPPNHISEIGIDGASGTTNSRWLSGTKARIGKCILFGMSRSQSQKAAIILKVLGEEWRELVAGREGFLTGPKRAGFLRHEVVWGEMDSMGHVNNVTYTRYAESARINWAYNYAVHVDPKNKKLWSELWTPNGDGLILRSIRTDYKFPMTWPDHISVFHKLRSLPDKDDSSFILDVMILSELYQRPAARCVEDIVVYDYRKGKKTAIRPFMMDVFRRTWEEQERARVRNERRVKDLDEKVRELELETWDRAGAKEDLGSGG